MKHEGRKCQSQEEIFEIFFRTDFSFMPCSKAPQSIKIGNRLMETGQWFAGADDRQFQKAVKPACVHDTKL